MTMWKPSRISLTAHRLTFRKPDPSTRHLDRFKTIGSHGIALGSSAASEALYASTGVSHLGGRIYQATAQKSTESILALLNKERLAP
jgi:hypothetical protein